MPSLDDIPIQVEHAGSGKSYGNAMPILNEIRHALARLAETGEPSQIDLAAMPFGPGDEDRLLALLGTGEVEASVEALGPTKVRETRFPGVWLVEYLNADGQRMALQIEVAETPQILRTQQGDLADSLASLGELLNSLADSADTDSTHPTSKH
jgi:hydrogenase-1 operon protein HyaF